MKKSFVFLLLILICNIAFSQVNLNLGLLAHFTFTGNANDESGNNFNGSPQGGVQLTTDRFGNANSAYQFDGINDRIIVSDNGGLSSPAFSICYYFMTTTNSIYQNCIGKINYIDGNGATYNSGIQPSDKPYFATIASLNDCFQQVPSTLVYTIFSPAPIQLNQWYCVVNTFENGVEKMYIDGVLVSQSNTPFNDATFCTNTDFLIGSWWQNDPIRFKGKMDDIRYYNRAINAAEVSALCSKDPCSSWLNTPSLGSRVKIGDLDISGNKMTIEATINRSTPYSGGSQWAGDVVSKHSDPTDVNYLLRPNNASITTTNGFFATPDVCQIELNKTYHIAMVYDGSTLKFYRNGFLMSQVPATGNLFQNSWNTSIGFYEFALYNSQFIGYINEVRIWNVARTQAQLQTYMNSSLPSPTSQSGLLAYYTFDDLLNKQGNSSWNGVLNGSASINNTNPNCSFIADSCNMLPPPGISGIINEYTPILAINPCNNSLTVEDGTKYNVGDTVLLIQMKGAIVDSSNTASFGNIIDYKNAGNYEFNYIKNKSGNIIELKNILTRQYDIPDGKVQLVRVPYYNSVNVSSMLTCLPWDGRKGGILVLNAKDTLNLQANIDVNGKGFKGGVGFNSNTAFLTCFYNDYFYPSTEKYAGLKGESITTVSNNIIRGKGKLAGGGGAGIGHNSGGGGGSNGGAGGYGGYQLDNCGSSPYDNRGLGGLALTYSSAINKIFLGSGGGAGQADNAGNVPPDGGNGGGIAFIIGGALKSNGFKIMANGNDATPCVTSSSSDCHDGMGGGGAGGVVIMNIAQIQDNTVAEKKGGKGADMTGSTSVGFGKLGSGGGGAGGVLMIKNNSLPPTINSINTGGANGVLVQDSNNSYGATPGAAGINVFNLSIPIDTILFKPNIDSVKIKDSAISCSGFNFKGLGFTNTTGITSWQWNFGDGFTANTQNTSHTYGSAGVFMVKLIVTDNNGCKDSTTQNVSNNAQNFDFNYSINVCNPLSVHFSGIGTDTLNPYWSFGDGGVSTGDLNPVHVYASEGIYPVKYSVTNGICTDTITKILNLNITPSNLILTNDTTICKGNTKQLITAPTLSFCWNPTTFLNDPNLPNPTTSSPQNITYYFAAEVTGTNLIINGDFSSGNSGFTSQYLYNPSSGFNAGVYNVGSNILAWHPGMSNCTDHTTGTGNLMMVNGSDQLGVEVWTQNVTVTPNTHYAFSTWLQHITSVNPAQLQFSINGIQVGPVFRANNNSCIWDRFYSVWNSGNNTTARISIVNQNQVFSGNDFALDDISFAPVYIKRDSVIISVENPLVRTIPDTSTCKGNAVQLTSNGASIYTWSPATGLNNPNISNPIATPGSTTQYVVTGITVNGCSAKDTVLLNIKPSSFSTIDQSICQGQTYLGQGTSGTYIDTLIAAGGCDSIRTLNLIVSSQLSSTINQSICQGQSYAGYNSSGIYIDTLISVNGCDSIRTINLTVNSPSFSTINQSICQGQNYSGYTANGTYIDTLSGVNGCDSIRTLNLTVNPTSLSIINQSICDGQTYLGYSTSGSYSDTLSASNGCDSIRTINLIVNPRPTVKTINDVIACTPQSITLNTTGASNYSWNPTINLSNPNSQSPVFTGTGTFTYFVSGTDLNGCTGDDTVTISVRNKQFFITPPDKTMCAKDSVRLNGNNGRNVNYLWSPANYLSNATAFDPIASPPASTSYTLLITDPACLSDTTFIVNITVNPLPQIKASYSNDINCSNSETKLNATGASQYVWSPSTGLSDIYIPNPIATPDSTTQYVVFGLDKGCINKDTIIVNVSGGKYYGFNVPNSFTPNGDRLNDCFGVKYWGPVENFIFFIFNRWGEKVFETRNQSDCWDGKYKGKLAPGGNYVYFISGKTLCGNVTKKGNVLLIQ